jgi:hypothetical protein
MRSIAFVLATFVASAPAAAQGWKEYSYPDFALSVAFPANPQVDTTTYQIADNRSVPARIYSVRQANVVFSMIVAELRGTNLKESAVVDQRIYQVYGRQLTLEGADGSRSMVQLFDYKNRLYQIEAKALPGQNVSNPSPT